jgi:ATP-dependent Clp protease ATP-binding subunit ClpA
VVVFRPLDRNAIMLIIDILLRDLRKRLEDREMDLVIAPAAKSSSPMKGSARFTAPGRSNGRSSV